MSGEMLVGILTKEKDRKRFFSKVKFTKDCWEWTASTGRTKSTKGRKDRNTYGRFRLDGKLLKAHRISYEFFKGSIPDGKCVCHTCDNPRCVNPAHLWAGTNTENMRDKIEKGRHGGPGNVGEDNPAQKYTEEMVIDMREHFAKGFSMKAISRKFNVPYSTTVCIIRRQRWTHI